jgi:rhodanese-related sulfurtransferase
MSLRGGEADAAILWCYDGGRKDDEIASLRSQGQKFMSLRGGEADAAILCYCDGGHKDDGIAALAMTTELLLCARNDKNSTRRTRS